MYFFRREPPMGHWADGCCRPRRYPPPLLGVPQLITDRRLPRGGGENGEKKQSYFYFKQTAKQTRTAPRGSKCSSAVHKTKAGTLQRHWVVQTVGLPHFETVHRFVDHATTLARMSKVAVLAGDIQMQL